MLIEAAVDLFILILFNRRISSLKALNLGRYCCLFTILYSSRLLLMINSFEDAPVYNTRSRSRVLNSEGLQTRRPSITIAPTPFAAAIAAAKKRL